MAPARPAKPKPDRTVDSDGVVRTSGRQRATGSSFFKISLAALIGLASLAGLIAWLMRRPAPATGPLPAAATARATAPGKSMLERPKQRDLHPSGGHPDGDETESDEGPAGIADENRGEGDPNVTTAAPREGLAALPPHGTKRIKVGIVVPEEFPLPPGYVRHFQTTDKGEMLSAILMFHPDYAPKDEQGRPVAIPADRVVPAELAPPGLPIELLRVPDDAYSKPMEQDPGAPGDDEADSPE